MEPFILLYTYFFCVWFLTLKISNEKAKKKAQVLYSFIGLLFLLGFKDPFLGSDMASYIPAFDNREASFSLEPDYVYGFEIGFLNYMSLVKMISSDNQVFILISALVILIPIAILIYKYSKNPMISIFIYTSWYLYYFSFSGLRQAIAVSICVIATLFMLRKRLIPFILTTVLASTIHTSALVFLFAYPLYWLKISTKVKLFAFFGMLLVLLMFKDIISLVADIVFRDNHYSGHINTATTGGVTIAIVYMFFALFQIFYNKNGTNPYISILLLISTIQFTGGYSQTIPRIAYYFLPLFALSFPEALSAINDKTRSIYTAVLIVLFISFFFLQASSHYLEVVPFRFFWE